jgi:Sulfotransferase domain
LKADFNLSTRLTRRRLRRWQALWRWRRSSFAGSPILFANSFPKSGTHLLTQVMHGFTRLGLAVDSGLPAVVTFNGFTGRQRSSAEILTDLRRLLPGDIAYGHVHAFPEAIDYLCQGGKAVFFILRDPRDVVVSHVHYVAEMAPNHIHHRYYHQVLQDFDQRLEASICGVPVSELEKATGMPIPQPLPDILSRFEPYLGWLERPEVLTLRFEEFVTDPEPAVGRVFDHAVMRGFETDCDRSTSVTILEESIDPGRSPTFRSGKIGEWRTVFKPRHNRLFEDIAGDLLTQLGYQVSGDD